MTITFEVNTADAVAIGAIVRRFDQLSVASGEPPLSADDKRRLEMDLTACHANGCRLRLHDLRVAKDAIFVHDVVGIMSHIDRTTGKLTRHFEPRFAAQEDA